jgi:tryptophanyl-tRNA synthetase
VACDAAGADLEVDVPWKYLNFFLEDDERLAEIGREYSSGRMLTGEIKAELIKVGGCCCLHALTLAAAVDGAGG